MLHVCNQCASLTKRSKRINGEMLCQSCLNKLKYCLIGIDGSRKKLREMQLKQIKDFRKKGWNEIADKMESELTKKMLFADSH